MDSKIVIRIPREEIGNVEVSFVQLKKVVQNFMSTTQLDDILKEIVRINEGYGDSWQQDGVFISLGDIKDKLTRAEILFGKDDSIAESLTTLDNWGNVVFDLFVRCLLLLTWDKHVKTYIREKYGIDIEDKRD